MKTTYIQKIKKLFQSQKRRMKQLEKRGYNLEKYKLPKVPKTGSKKEYERLLKSLSLGKLYEKATYTTESGQILKGNVARERERSRAAIKAAKTRKETAPRGSFEMAVINNFKREITESRGNEYAINKLLALLNDMIKTYGITGTAYILTERLKQAQYYINDALRPSATEEEVDNDMVMIAEILKPDLTLVERRLLS